MLPLHSEFRREQPEQRHLFDVNLFDEPDERYEDYPIETGTGDMANFWISKIFAAPIAANPIDQLTPEARQIPSLYILCLEKSPEKVLRQWQFEATIPSNCESNVPHWLPSRDKC